MSARILICIPCHNRRAIAEACIPTVHQGVMASDRLVIYDDASEELERPRVSHLCDDYVRNLSTPSGVELQRKRHFIDFQAENFTHLYLADADALHDPRWREQALWLQKNHEQAPVCLYNTDAHVRLIGNTIKDDPKSDVIWRRVAPGISYLLTAEHVAQVMKALPMMPPHWNWDWTVPALLGHRMAISRTSYVDHIGLGGMHHPAGESLDGGDRALNPTAWLVSKRAEVVAKLSSPC